MKGNTMYLRLLPQRGCGEEPIDCEQLVREALEAVECTYTTLTQMVMAFNDDSDADHRLVTMLAQARNANNKMLSTLRHPAGGK